MMVTATWSHVTKEEAEVTQVKEPSEVPEHLTRVA